MNSDTDKQERKPKHMNIDNAVQLGALLTVGISAYATLLKVKGVVGSEMELFEKAKAQEPAAQALYEQDPSTRLTALVSAFGVLMTGKEEIRSDLEKMGCSDDEIDEMMRERLTEIHLASHGGKHD